MSTALYRRYRPQTFADVIGQEHVTEPLQQALRAGRIGHAYLFSGPRGCGKTTSARILARCLNCEQGPTPTPCGVCESCVALARGGPGSVDVIEIDAASHGGVDDARDLREKASYGPAQSRFKVYIIDEAHMVTPQGFNALLKIVEEPPEHVKFVFATTEPEKVIGTIRSRTHHYPFRLVPPARLQSYLEELCEAEGVQVEPGVLSFVIRAGGGSVRDSLSVLDQLMAGAGDEGLTYAGAAALLGFTEAELLDATIDAFAAGDGAAVFRQIDRVIETGQDPRRFVEDLLERFRDLVVVAAVNAGGGEGLSALFRGLPSDQLDRMSQQAAAFGPGELSHAADIVNAGLTEMTGATSPRLQLELICARVLLPASAGEQGYAARIDRIEKRLEMAGPQPPSEGPVPRGRAAVPRRGADAERGDVAARGDRGEPRGAKAGRPAPEARGLEGRPAPAVQPTTGPETEAPRSAQAQDAGSAGRRVADDGWPEEDDAPVSRGVDARGGQPATDRRGEAGRPAGDRAPGSGGADARGGRPGAGDASGRAAAGAGQAPARGHDGGPAGGFADPATESTSDRGAGDDRRREDHAAAQDAQDGPRGAGGEAAQAPERRPAARGGLDTDAMRRAWPDVLAKVFAIRRVTWTFLSEHAQVLDFDGERLLIGITTGGLAATFRNGRHGEVVRQALIEARGIDTRVESVAMDEARGAAGQGGAGRAPAGGGDDRRDQGRPPAPAGESTQGRSGRGPAGRPAQGGQPGAGRANDSDARQGRADGGRQGRGDAREGRGGGRSAGPSCPENAAQPADPDPGPWDDVPPPEDDWGDPWVDTPPDPSQDAPRAGRNASPRDAAPGNGGPAGSGDAWDQSRGGAAREQGASSADEAWAGQRGQGSAPGGSGPAGSGDSWGEPRGGAAQGRGAPSPSADHGPNRTDHQADSRAGTSSRPGRGDGPRGGGQANRGTDWAARFAARSGGQGAGDAGGPGMDAPEWQGLRAGAEASRHSDPSAGWNAGGAPPAWASADAAPSAGEGADPESGATDRADASAEAGAPGRPDASIRDEVEAHAGDEPEAPADEAADADRSVRAVTADDAQPVDPDGRPHPDDEVGDVAPPAGRAAPGPAGPGVDPAAPVPPEDTPDGDTAPAPDGSAPDVEVRRPGPPAPDSVAPTPAAADSSSNHPAPQPNPPTPPANPAGAPTGGRRRGIEAFREARRNAAARATTAAPTAPGADDDAAQFDDENIDDLGAVGQPVIASVLGGTVIAEIDG